MSGHQLFLCQLVLVVDPLTQSAERAEGIEPVDVCHIFISHLLFLIIIIGVSAKEQTALGGMFRESLVERDCIRWHLSAGPYSNATRRRAIAGRQGRGWGSGDTGRREGEGEEAGQDAPFLASSSASGMPRAFS